LPAADVAAVVVVAELLLEVEVDVPAVHVVPRRQLLRLRRHLP
jgi:hypothetical protein